MKKQMIALAVAGAFAGSAFAANVDMYGVVDTGLVYTQTEVGGVFRPHGCSHVRRRHV